MNLKVNLPRLAGVAALLLAVAACGSSSAGTKATLYVAGFNFPESSVLAEIYGQALAHDGYTVNYSLLLGSRQIVAPAIEHAEVDIYPAYAASDLEFYNNHAGEATSDATATTAKLNARLQPLGLVALTPSPAVDKNAFAVTKALADQYHLTKISDLVPIASQLVLGAGPECPANAFCLPGLMRVYGLHFKEFKTLDTDGPATRAAFKNGSIQVGLVFTTDSDLESLGLVVLQDDMNLTAADNVVPILRQAVATDEVKSVLNAVSAKLTTADLIAMNMQTDLQHQDPDVVAKAWLEQHNYGNS